MVTINMKKSAIIIPVYYENPTRLDMFSLNSLNNNLTDFKDFDVCLVHPEGLGCAQWKRHIDHDVISRPFSEENFYSTLSYSKMLETYEFWNTFSEYEYALIFQTDGYCVGGSLKEWTDRGYDYIGGPIIATDARWFNVPAVGNGGVSLRKVSTMIEVTDPDGEFMKESSEDIKRHDETNGQMYSTYEDLYFAQLVPMLWEFTKPQFEEAANFCFDMNPEFVYEMVGQKLPLFVHAFDKNIRFYENLIEDFKDIDIISDCEDKNRDGYLNPEVGYHKDIEHEEPIRVCAVIPVRMENYHINDTINRLISQGVSKVFLIDNNDLTSEDPSLVVDTRYAEVIKKFRGEKHSDELDLISNMLSYAYTFYAKDYDYCLIIDADEEIHFNTELMSIRKLCESMRTDKVKVLHIPCVVVSADGTKSEYQNNVVKSLVKTGLDIRQWTRETPITQYKAKNGCLMYDEPCSTTSTCIETPVVYISNWMTGKSKEEFLDHKLNRGYPDCNTVIGKKLTSEDLWDKVNGKSSTIEIG